MDEKIPGPSLSGHAALKQRSFPLFRLGGAFLFGCLVLSRFTTPAVATKRAVSPAPSMSVSSIPQAATPAG